MLSYEKQRIVQKTIDKYMRMADDLYTHIDWYEHNITWDTSLKGKTAGTATYKSNKNHRIRLNEQLLMDNFQFFIDDTIPHEIAHIVTFIVWDRKIRPHGKEWKSVMENFGVTPKRTHSLDITKVARNTKKFKWKCDCNTHYVGMRKHKKMMLEHTRYICKRCNTEVTYTNEQTDYKTLAAQRAKT